MLAVIIEVPAGSRGLEQRGHDVGLRQQPSPHESAQLDRGQVERAVAGPHGRPDDRGQLPLHGGPSVGITQSHRRHGCRACRRRRAEPLNEPARHGGDRCLGIHPPVDMAGGVDAWREDHVAATRHPSIDARTEDPGTLAAITALVLLLTVWRRLRATAL